MLDVGWEERRIDGMGKEEEQIETWGSFSCEEHEQSSSCDDCILERGILVDLNSEVA